MTEDHHKAGAVYYDRHLFIPPFVGAAAIPFINLSKYACSHAGVFVQFPMALEAYLCHFVDNFYSRGNDYGTRVHSLKWQSNFHVALTRSLRDN